MKKYLLFLFILFLVSCQKSHDVHVVLLAGQSNMDGAGNYHEIPDSLLDRIHKISDSVLLSYKGDEASPLSYRISDHHKEKYGFAERFGPEMMLGLTLAEKHPNQEYLFIKYAQGGTSLHGAWNPNWDATKAEASENQDFKKKLKLCELHHKQIKHLLSELEKEGKSYKIIGMAWMQGENDAAKELCARKYEMNLKNLIASYRKAYSDEKMPFVIGQINSTYGRFADGPQMVRQAMLEVAKSDKKVGVIATTTDTLWSDYPKHSDHVHYNTKGQLRLGKAFAEKLLLLQ